METRSGAGKSRILGSWWAPLARPAPTSAGFWETSGGVCPFSSPLGPILLQEPELWDRQVSPGFHGIKSLFRAVSIPASLQTWCPHRNRGSRRDRSGLGSLSGGFLTSVPISELLLPKFGAFTPNSRPGIRVQLSSTSGRDGGGLIPPQFGNSEEFCGKKSIFLVEVSGPGGCWAGTAPEGHF